MEDDDLVDAVEELRSEDRAQRLGDSFLHLLVGGLVALAGVLRDELAPDVAGHDDDRVLEVDGAALAVGQAAVVEDLEQDVEDVRMGLLDLVEQDDLVRPPPDRLGELAALVVADVAGRRTDESRYRELLHVLAHVDARHRVLVVEEELGEGARELGLPDAGRTQEDERADGTARVLEAGARPTDRIGHGRDGLVLADDALVQAFLHADELRLLALHEPRHRDAGPAGHDARDVVRVDLFLEQPPRAVVLAASAASCSRSFSWSSGSFP